MPTLPRLIALPLTLLASACTTAGLAVINLPTHFSSAYTLASTAYGAQPWQQLDIYQPTAGTVPHGVIVFFYGGRWTSGERADYRFVGARLAQRGFTVVIPDYSKYPIVRFPAFVEDGALAVKWTHEHIGQYGGNPNRLFVAGHSAGAHIGALLSADPAYGVRNLITRFAGLAGPYDFTPDEPDLMDMFGPPANYPNMQVTTFIDGHQPPMLLQHGDADTTVKSVNHEKLAARINQRGGIVSVKTYADISHISIISAFSWVGHKAIVNDMVDFFNAAP